MKIIVNSEEAYTLDKRIYHYSMYGTFGMSNSIASNVGVNKFLTYNPKIKSARGYIDPTDSTNVQDLDMSNQMTAVEMLTPYTVNHDDRMRVVNKHR